MAAGLRHAQFGGKARARHRRRRRSTIPIWSGSGPPISMAACAQLPRRPRHCASTRSPEHMLPPPPDLTTSTHGRGRIGSCSGSSSTASSIPACRPGSRSSGTMRFGPSSPFSSACRRLDAQGYRDLAMGNLADGAAERPRHCDRWLRRPRPSVACARCHGADDRPPQSALVPILHGQPAEFLAAALRAYADGKRESGIMQPVAADLSSEAMQRVADYYAGLPRPLVAAGRARIDAAAIANGRALATRGLAGREIPPCLPCHGADALDTFPRLGGQHAPYMKTQLRLWKRGAGFGYRNRRHHGADRAAAQRPADRGRSRLFLRVRRRPRPRHSGHEGSSDLARLSLVPLVALIVLPGCRDIPIGTGAARSRTRCESRSSHGSCSPSAARSCWSSCSRSGWRCAAPPQSARAWQQPEPSLTPE